MKTFSLFLQNVIPFHFCAGGHRNGSVGEPGTVCSDCHFANAWPLDNVTVPAMLGCLLDQG